MSYWNKFKKNRLSYVSAILLLGLSIILAGLEWIANDKPIFISHNNEWFFPVINTYPETTFGGVLDTEADYRNPVVQALILNKNDSGNRIIWPLIPYSYNTLDYDLEAPSPSSPSRRHWLGTDTYGRDLLSFTLYSLRFALVFGIILTFASSILGVIIGAVQGYFGGIIDLIGQRFLEIWGGLPQLFILIILAGIITPSFISMLLILLLFSWTSLVPPVRAEFLKARNLDYVRAARALGVSNIMIMFRHILPNAMVATFTFTPFILTGSMVALASLDYLGLGLPIGSPALGEVLRQGKENTQAPWIGLTGFFVMGTVLSLLMFIAEGVRNTFDPRRKTI